MTNIGYQLHPWLRAVRDAGVAPNDLFDPGNTKEERHVISLGDGPDVALRKNDTVLTIAVAALGLRLGDLITKDFRREPHIRKWIPFADAKGGSNYITAEVYLNRAT